MKRLQRLIVHAGHAMRAQHHPHLLQHVAVVVDARLIDPDRSGDPGGLELVEGGDLRLLQTEPASIENCVLRGPLDARS